MGLFDGVKRALGGHSIGRRNRAKTIHPSLRRHPPDPPGPLPPLPPLPRLNPTRGDVSNYLGGGSSSLGRRQSIKSTPWAIDEDGISRQYTFSNFDDLSRDVLFQLLCKVDIGSSGCPHYVIVFGFQPMVTQGEGYLLCQIATIDDQIETGFVPVKVSCQHNMNLFLIDDVEVVEQCLAVLIACKPMKLILVNNRGASIVRIPIDNDINYRIKLTELQDRVMSSRTRQHFATAPQHEPRETASYETEERPWIGAYPSLNLAMSITTALELVEQQWRRLAIAQGSDIDDEEAAISSFKWKPSTRSTMDDFVVGYAAGLVVSSVSKNGGDIAAIDMRQVIGSLNQGLQKRFPGIDGDFS